MNIEVPYIHEAADVRVITPTGTTSRTVTLPHDSQPFLKWTGKSTVQGVQAGTSQPLATVGEFSVCIAKQTISDHGIEEILYHAGTISSVLKRSASSFEGKLTQSLPLPTGERRTGGCERQLWQSRPA